MPLSFPDTPDILTSDEAGLFAAQSVPFTFTLTEILQQINYISVIYLSDATVGLRQPFVNFFSDTGALYWQVFGLSTTPAGVLEQHYYPQGQETFVLGAAAVTANLPAQFYMKRDWTMTFGDLNTISAGDLQFIRFEFDVLVRSSNAFA